MSEGLNIQYKNCDKLEDVVFKILITLLHVALNDIQITPDAVPPC